MRLIVAFLTVFLFFGCITKKKCEEYCSDKYTPTETTFTKKDSSWTSIDKKKDTVYISVPGTTVIVPGPCDSLCDKEGNLKPFYRETRNNGVKTKLFTDKTKNQLIVFSDIDSLLHINEQLTITINRLVSEKKTTKNNVKLKCEKTHKDWLDSYDRPVFFIFIGALLLFLGKYLLKYKKFFINLLK